ncbi:MAG: type II toxin-antitoxin system Phd/YefM family antitoxin [Spirochaetales bacterium]|nr:type II toxin-antitoxin system Phd/YefM family antitoxin [Spirochaetales bacterium]
MPIIRPISDLRNNFTSISEAVHSDEQPIFLTKNGNGDMVVMSIEYYEKQLARIELYQKLNEAREEIQNGAIGKDARNVLKGLMST